MDAVIKVGGSLSEDPATLKVLGKAISEIAKTHQIVVVPGGGKFADTVRDLDAKFSLPATVSHRMAILAMDQYGLLLTHVIPDSQICSSLKDAFTVSGTGAVPVFLPATLLLEGDPFTPSWEVTSDSIAAYIASQLDAPKVVCATDVDGSFTHAPKQNPNANLLSTVSVRELRKFGQHTSVDTFLPQLLLKYPLDGYVVNGNFPDRLKAVLAGEPTVCTHIVC